jgi:hypothetical protein
MNQGGESLTYFYGLKTPTEVENTDIYRQCVGTQTRAEGLVLNESADNKLMWTDPVAFMSLNFIIWRHLL